MGYEQATVFYDNAGKEFIRMNLWVEYENKRGESDSTEKMDLLLPVKGRTSLEESIKHAMEYESFEQFPEMWKERYQKVERDTCHSQTAHGKVRGNSSD